MPSWAEVASAAPVLAAAVEGRFNATGLGLLATVRAGGAPRISPVEPLFAAGELWMGSMPDSRKAADLMRDPRFALHAATADKNVADGDAKLAGRADLVDDDATLRRFLEAFEARTGYAPPPPFPLFRADVTEVSFLKPAGDHLDIDIWTVAGGLRRVERR